MAYGQAEGLALFPGQCPCHQSAYVNGLFSLVVQEESKEAWAQEAPTSDSDCYYYFSGFLQQTDTHKLLCRIKENTFTKNWGEHFEYTHTLALAINSGISQGVCELWNYSGNSITDWWKPGLDNGYSIWLFRDCGDICTWRQEVSGVCCGVLCAAEGGSSFSGWLGN